MDVLKPLRNFKEKHNVFANITIMILCLLIAGVGVGMPLSIGGLMPTIGAIALDVCALPTFIELIHILTE